MSSAFRHRAAAGHREWRQRIARAKAARRQRSRDVRRHGWSAVTRTRHDPWDDPDGVDFDDPDLLDDD